MARAIRLIFISAAICVAVSGCRLGTAPKFPFIKLISVDEQRIGAMISIHAHAEYHRVNLPDDLRVMPLEDAVEFLRDDRNHDYFGKSRQHRAIAKLFAYD